MLQYELSPLNVIDNLKEYNLYKNETNFNLIRKANRTILVIFNVKFEYLQHRNYLKNKTNQKYQIITLKISLIFINFTFDVQKINLIDITYP